MGGRGSMMKPLGERVYEYRVVEFLAGIKVLKSIYPKRQPDLPKYSNTPGTSYIQLNKDGSFHRLRKYGKDRRPVSDIDSHSIGNKMSLHKNIYKNGVRLDGHFPLTGAEKRRYGKIIKALEAKKR